MKRFVTCLSLFIGVAIVITCRTTKQSLITFTKMKHQFFTLIKQFEVENKLVQSNFPKNTSLALEHAENAARLLKDIFYFDEDNSDDNNFVDTYDSMSKDLNSTTSALIAANLADEILKQYGMAVGLNSTSASKLTSMSMTIQTLWLSTT